MDEAEQARAYADADFAEVNQSFVDGFRDVFPEFERGRVVDLGCGPADIPIRLCRALRDVEVVGCDGAESMLALGRQRVAGAGLSDRIQLVPVSLPMGAPTLGRFDAGISNSLLHHLHDPMVLWESLSELLSPGAPIYVVDLFRPSTEERVDELVETYARGEAPLLARDFRASLHAAFTLDEVNSQLAKAGLYQLAVEEISDRHLRVAGRLV